MADDKEVAVKKNCAFCKFYAVQEFMRGKDIHGDAQCRRHAPTVRFQITTQSYGGSTPVWPVCQSDDWCGDWEHWVNGETLNV